MSSEEGVSVRWDRGRRGGFMSHVRKRVPILDWGRRYTRLDAAADAVAGLTLGLTLVPQSIAYASLAGLPVQYGLYSAFVGTIVYMFLGTVKEVSIGPTSLMALLTLQITRRGLPVEYVVLLAFFSGCVVMIMGILKLGFIVDLISESVTSGFTSATAVIIVATQLKGLLGISFVAENVFENLYLIWKHRAEIQCADFLLALGCCTILLLLRKLKDLPVGPKKAGLKKALWFVSISRNAIVVCGASVLAFCLHEEDQPPMFKLSGRVEPGLPRVSLPAFSVELNNQTQTLPDMLAELGPLAAMTPLVMVLANVAIAKAFTVGSRVDATQEMVTLGACNMLGSLVHAMPTCGAFTRSAVSHSSGVRTPAAGLYSGIITLVALTWLTQYFYFIPKACLSSVLVCAVIFMIDFDIVVRLWRRSRLDLVVLCATALVALVVSVELAVLVGMLMDLALLLHKLMRPVIDLHTVKLPRGRVSRVVPACVVSYLSAEQFARRVLALLTAADGDDRSRPPVFLDCAALSVVDFSALQAIERVIEKLKESDQQLILYNASAELARTLRRLRGADTRALRSHSAHDALDACAGRVSAPLDAHDPLLLAADGHLVA